jgi:hypothetical protein
VTGAETITAVPRVGRILVGAERAAREASEAAREVPGEVRRTAFAISGSHLLTAWHCVRDALDDGAPLWFRLRREPAIGRRYIYVPVRVTNYDYVFDVAALAMDPQRLPASQLSAEDVVVLFAASAFPLSLAVQVKDAVQVIGFPASGSGADSDTNGGEVVEVALPLGDVAGLKIYSGALGAVDPVDPHGLSGGPVLQLPAPGSLSPRSVVGIVRAAPAGTMPTAASGGCVVATCIADITGRLPEVVAALAAVPPEPALPVNLAAASGINARTVAVQCARLLRESVSQYADGKLGTLVGWTHFLHESKAGLRPTAIGTAYGIKLALVLDEPDGRLDRAALAETLWKLQLPGDGGWAARTGSGIARPEITALVLGALSQAGGDQVRLASAAAAFEAALAPGADPEGMQRTHVVTAAMRGLMRVRPASRRLAELRRALLAGAVQDPENGNLTCWSNLFETAPQQARVPSVAHTAMAVIALVRAGQVLNDEQGQPAIGQAVRWLIAQRDLANVTEQIRRFVNDRHSDSLTVKHFTAAWVARALLVASPGGQPDADVALTSAVRKVWQAQRDGAWEWDDGDRTLWMMYQGASVMRDYAMRACPPL